MKKNIILLLSLACLMLLPCTMRAQQVTFAFPEHELYDGDGNAVNTDRVAAIERNITSFLNALASAGREGKAPALDGVKMGASAAGAIKQICAGSRLNFQRERYVCNGIDNNGVFRVDGINLSQILPNDIHNCRMSIMFTADGNITSVTMKGAAPPDTIPVPVPVGNFDEVKFEFPRHQCTMAGGVSLSGAEVAKIESNISRMLTALQKAARNGVEPDFSGVALSADAKADLKFCCKNRKVACRSNSYKAACLNDADGMLVRGIAVNFIPTQQNAKDSVASKHLNICFLRDGTISSVTPAFDEHAFLLDGNFEAVKDQEYLNTIKKFVENFRQYYEQGNIEALKKIYSENALIITGKVIKTVKRDKDLLKNDIVSDDKKGKKNSDNGSTTIVYRKQRVSDYLANLERLFSKPNFKLNLDFKDIKVERCGLPGKTNFYGVSLVQKWDTRDYDDVGYLFLLWQFDPEGVKPPQIYIRTWEPLDVDPNKRFSLGSCDFR